MYVGRVGVSKSDHVTFHAAMHNWHIILDQSIIAYTK